MSEERDSVGVPVDVGSVPELLLYRAQTSPDAIAVSLESEQSATYHDLHERAGAVQAWLQDRGVAPGDAVAILMANSLEFLYVWLGITYAGAVGVPINTASVGEALRYPLVHSDAVVLFIDDDLWPAMAAVEPIPALRWVVSPGHRASTGDCLKDVLAHPPASFQESVDPLDPMNIVYTSGTTGMPKGVVLSHRSYLNTGSKWVEHFGLGPGDVLHTCLPLFHCNAQQTTLMGGLHSGARIALNRKFSVRNFWSWITDSDATLTSLLGAMMLLLAKSDGERAGRRLRYINGAPVPKSMHDGLERRFGVRIVEGYGLTETGTMAALNPVGDRRGGTFGRPLGYTEIRIMRPDGTEASDGEQGEIVVRSSIRGAFMSGYYKEPDLTAQVMRDGWFHTGDAGYRRPDGWFVFADRMKDTIRRRGENISSFLVEKIIGDHLQVQEVAAVAVPSELTEDDVKVFCVLKPGATLTEEELSLWCGANVPDYMRPRYIEFVDSFPRTETGRVQKVELRKLGIHGAWDLEATDGSPRAGL